MTHPGVERAARVEQAAGSVLPIRRVDIAASIMAIAMCIVAGTFLFAHVFGTWWSMLKAHELVDAAVHGAFLMIVLIMQFSVFVYLVTRLAQLNRQQDHRPPSADELERVHVDPAAPGLAALVPAYKEDLRVIRRTLLSAALIEYPHRHVVLLIDNPPEPDDLADAELLRETRRLPDELNGLLRQLARPFTRALHEYEQRLSRHAPETGRGAGGEVEGDLRRLAALYDLAAGCLRQIEVLWPPADHEDACFAWNCLRKPANGHLARAAELRSAAGDASRHGKWEARIEQEYRRLASLFRVDVSSFERKRFANLSREPNKAMNLNSYLGLMGKVVSERPGPGGLELHEPEQGRGGHAIPDADFVITLDADSVLHPAYALKLVRFLEQPGNERVAVVQTPYSAFPGAGRILERVAGATTDIQYLLHQGFTRFNATFWVGANALLRKRALEDIATYDVERGHPITRYIQDNTVIEDTESSVDLVAEDWRLHNYPERLAWSATPADFGALLIQRRRWANGGLIILPKFLRYVTRRRPVPHRLAHAAIGWHYLTSLATTNLGIVALLLLPVEAGMQTWWLPGALAVYFVTYGRDLVRLGYRAGDVFNVYALTLLLVPVHLAGVVKSVHQMVTGSRTPFGRTPKVLDRTAVPLLYLGAVYVLLAGCALLVGRDLASDRALHSLFNLVHGAMLGYALVRFVGLRESLLDVRLATAGMRRRLPSALRGWRSRVPVPRAAPRLRRPDGGPERYRETAA